MPSTAWELFLQTHPMLLSKAVAVANNLACRGLDHLEEKIPALQYPVDKVSHRQDSLRHPSPSAEPTAYLLWTHFWMVMGCWEGKKATSPSKGSSRGSYSPGDGWGTPKPRSTVSYVPSLPNTSSLGWKELLCPTLGCLVAWPWLESPWSLWLSHATPSTPAGLISISPPTARI